MANEVKDFHWADYLVFALFLVLSALIGIIIGVKDRRRMTSRNFLTGGGNMHWSLVALSMQASFLSAIFILSIPVEIYAWGTMYYYLVVSYLLAIPFSGYFYMSLFYRLNILTAYEYLEIRFGRTARTCCALTFCVQILLYLSVVLYTPALALAQVTDLSIPVSIALCGIVCTFYTVLGGMKATIWNDFFQMIIIASTLVCLIVFGTLKVGGFSRVWQISREGGRIEFDDFRIDPTVKTTFWTQVVGGSVITMTTYASNQTVVQKFISVRTMGDARKSVWMATFSSALFLTLVSVVGLVAYANYWDCDPLKSGQILKYDQLIPHLVMDVMGHLHGLPGLFIAATFSAALSSLSGSLTALSAVILSDFIDPLSVKINGRPLEERMKSVLTKAFTLSLGVLVTCLGFAAQFFGEVVVQVTFGIFGFVGGPLLAVVSLGIFVPLVNEVGAVSGLISSLVITSLIAVGATLAGVPHETLPMSTEGCHDNSTVSGTSFNHDLSSRSPQDQTTLGIFRISFMYYGVVAIIISAVVAVPVSLLTGRTRTLKANLVMDVRRKCCCCCCPPLESGTNRLCGTDLEEEEEEKKEDLSEPEMWSKSFGNGYTNQIFDEKNEITLKVSLSEVCSDLPSFADIRQEDRATGSHGSWSDPSSCETIAERF